MLPLRPHPTVGCWTSCVLAIIPHRGTRNVIHFAKSADVLLKPQLIPSIPQCSALRFLDGNLYFRIRIKLGVLYRTTSELSSRHQPATSSWRLALISLLQQVEEFSRTACPPTRGTGPHRTGLLAENEAHRSWLRSSTPSSASSAVV